MIGHDKERLTSSEEDLLLYIKLVEAYEIHMRSTSEVYEEYLDYCKRNLVLPVSLSKFTRWVNYELQCRSESRRTEDGHSHKVFIC